MESKDYIVVVQCHIVMERCSGYFCEKAFNERKDGFSGYSQEQEYRTLYLTCGGCCGRAVHRKLNDLIRMIKKSEEIDRNRIIVHFASCITRYNYHGPPCPHIDYLRTMIKEKLSLDLLEYTTISEIAEERRKKGVYGEPLNQ